MDLDTKTAKHFKLDPDACPFGDTPPSPDAIFRWKGFDEVVDRIVDAVMLGKFIVVAGNFCSSKSTAWHVADEQLADDKVRRRYDVKSVLIAEPAGLDPGSFSESTVYRAIVESMGDGVPLRKSTPARAAQCRQLLRLNCERQNASAFVVNDAQACRPEFLLICKRLWDQMEVYQRLIGVVLIGQIPLVRAVQQIGEIDQRKELVLLPGLGQHLGEYLAHEVQRAGGRLDALMTGEAIAQLAGLSKRRKAETEDHPHRVNVVMQRALRIARRSGETRVDGPHVEKALAGLGDTWGDDEAAPVKRGPRLSGN